MDHNIIEALESIRERHGGVLRPADVVEHARSEASPLHQFFQWDDTKAAEAYRRWQARSLIARVRITKPDGAGQEVKVRLYQSLSSDRVGDGGYRELDEVLEDEEMRADMLATALGEFQSLQRKYEALEKLAPVFKAIDKVAAAVEEGEAKGKQGRKGGDAEARPTP